MVYCFHSSHRANKLIVTRWSVQNTFTGSLVHPKKSKLLSKANRFFVLRLQLKPPTSPDSSPCPLLHNSLKSALTMPYSPASEALPSWFPLPGQLPYPPGLSPGHSPPTLPRELLTPCLARSFSSGPSQLPVFIVHSSLSFQHSLLTIPQDRKPHKGRNHSTQCIQRCTWISGAPNKISWNAWPCFANLML